MNFRGGKHPSVLRGRAGSRSLIRPLMAALCVVTLASAAACGSSASSGGGGGAPVSSAQPSQGSAQPSQGSAPASKDAAAAAALVGPYLKPPTSIGITQPLTRAPRKGLKVALVNTDDGGGNYNDAPFLAAANYLGWIPKLYLWHIGDPQSANAAVDQAVADGSDYIIVEGLPSAAYAEGLAKAKAAGIPVIQNDTVAEPDAKSKGIIWCSSCAAVNHDVYAKIIADWTIADSGGTANVVYLNVPEFPTAVAGADASKAEYAAHCKGCTFDVLGVSAQDLEAGKLPGAVVAYLQSHPHTNYIACMAGGVCLGVRAAMKSAGIGDNVKITVTVPQPESVQELKDHGVSAVTAYSTVVDMYRAVDAVARYSLGMSLEPTLTPMPTMIWTQETSSAAQANGWPGPSDGVEQFHKLWGGS